MTFIATNSLQGVDTDDAIASHVSGTCYVLSGGSEGVGFYMYQAPNQLKAHKAFIDVPSGNPAPSRLRFVFNEENAATSIEANSQQPMANSQKLIENGQLYIIRNGVRYNAQGMIVK